jgi:hypothetical protein
MGDKADVRKKLQKKAQDWEQTTAILARCLTPAEAD